MIVLNVIDNQIKGYVKTGQNGFYPFLTNFLAKYPRLKLFRDMPLFWNSIFRKSSFKCKTLFLDNRVIAKLNLDFFFSFSGTWVPLEYFQGTRVPQFFFFFFFFKFPFAITWLSKNQVLNWNSIFRKSSFKTRAFS